MSHELKALEQRLNVIESDKILRLTSELNYLKSMVNYQTKKIDKLTNLLTDVLKNDNNMLALSSLQDGPVNVVPHNVGMNMQMQNGNISSNSIPPPISAPISAPIGSIPSSMSSDRNSLLLPELPDNINDTNSSIVSNGKRKRRKEDKKDTQQSPAGEKPKVVIDFIHNPMTVKEIYDEYTKGFKGQPPLSELDDRFGKMQWRGDSRSKESKRFQRRKRLCDAITRGMTKYNKLADEIIAYIERHRGDKSLTWVMNGNIPLDLRE